MRTIRIDCNAHYEIREDGNVRLLVAFPEGCPRMGERPPFSSTEGEVVAFWEKGEVVEFVWGVSVGSPGATSEIVCGDDLRYLLSDMED